MIQLLSRFKYTCQERLDILDYVNQMTEFMKAVDEKHPLFLFYRTFKDNPDERKKILYGDDVEYSIQLNEDDHYNWEIFEYVVLLPLFSYRRLIPGILSEKDPSSDLDGSLDESELPSIQGEVDALDELANKRHMHMCKHDFTVIDDQDSEREKQNYNGLQISTKITKSEYYVKIKQSIETIANTIHRLSGDLNEDIRKHADSRALSQDDAVHLICGSEFFDEFQFPGYETIIERIKICHEKTASNTAINWNNIPINCKDTPVNWEAWIQSDKLSEQYRICSVLDEECINTALSSLFEKKMISTEIIREKKDKGNILGGITVVKNVFKNRHEIMSKIKKLQFIEYPDTAKDKINHIRVASTKTQLPLQYSANKTIFFVLSRKIEQVEEELLQECNDIAFKIYMDTKHRLIQKYGPKVAKEIIGKFIPFTSCLWSLRPANEAGYGLHQDSTSLSSDKGLHYQEIVVTIVFHLERNLNEKKGASLQVSRSSDGKKFISYDTEDNSIHVQLVGNQANLHHKAGSIGSQAKGYRLVMTARRTGVDNPDDVMNEMIRLSGYKGNFNDKKFLQDIIAPTLETIVEFEGILPGVSHRATNHSQLMPPKKAKSKKGVKRKDRNQKMISESNFKVQVDTITTEVGNELPIDSKKKRAYGPSHYYQIDTTSVQDAESKTYIEYSHGPEFFLNHRSLEILFRKNICVRTFDGKNWVTWAPMFEDDGTVMRVGIQKATKFYKRQHYIQNSRIGGHIVSNDPRTATGICLLHPERTENYNDVVDAARDHRSVEFQFYGSGGSAKVMGSHPSLISAPLCGKGGSFASNQNMNNRNTCLMDICKSDRPVHIAMKVKSNSNECGDRDEVIYLGMFVIEGCGFGLQGSEKRDRFEKGKNCDNLIGASFLDAKVFRFKAVPFPIDYCNDVNRDKWKVYPIDTREAPLSCGIMVPNKTATKFLKGEANSEPKRDIVFDAMSGVEIEKILPLEEWTECGRSNEDVEGSEDEASSDEDENNDKEPMNIY